MAKRCCMLGLLPGGTSNASSLPSFLSRTPSPCNAHSWKFNRSQGPRVRNIFPVLRCEERQVGRDGPARSLCHDSLLAAGTDLLVPCCPTSEREVVSYVAKFPTNVPCGVWTLHPTLLTGARAPKALHSLLQLEGEVQLQGPMVPPLSPSPAPLHPQSWQQETCMSFPAVSWTPLTPSLQNLMITFPELSWRQRISPWELSERSWMSFHRKSECSSTCSLWLHHLVYDLFKSCTHFQGRLHHTSQSKHPKSQFSSWCLLVTVWYLQVDDDEEAAKHFAYLPTSRLSRIQFGPASQISSVLWIQTRSSSQYQARDNSSTNSL